MAVDYTKVNGYSQQKNLYDQQIKSANKADTYAGNNDIITNTLQYTGTGASLGAGIGGVPGAFLGGAGGLLVGLGVSAFRAFSGANDTNQRSANNVINSNITSYRANAETEQLNRNTLISQSKRYINQTKTSFNATYGSGSYSILEQTLNTLMDIESGGDGARLTEILLGMKEDTKIGDIETRILQQDYVSDGGILTAEQLQSLKDGYVPLDMLGNAYVNSLYSNLLKYDSAFTDSIKDTDRELKEGLRSLDTSLEYSADTISSALSELFYNQELQNISYAENIGEVASDEGANGFRASSGSRIATRNTKLKQDIANASYAISVDKYINQLKQQAESSNEGRINAYYNWNRTIRDAKKQLRSTYLNGIAELFSTTVDSISGIAESETSIDFSMAQAQAGINALKEANENNKNFSYDKDSNRTTILGKDNVATTSNSTV